MGTEIKTRLRLRKDTLENWSKFNPVLLDGELALVETEDGVKMKLGDGSTAFNNLPWFNQAEEVEINENTFVFEDDLQTMYTLGKYNGTKASPATIPAKGKTFDQVWKDIFQVEENPTTTQPSLTINSSSLGSKEVGTKVSAAYTTSFSEGKYTYDSSTGVTASDYKIKFNGETLTGTSGTFAELTVGDSTSLGMSGTFDHTDGIIPHTNIGNEYSAGQIKAKDDKAATSAAGTLTGYRNMFFGTMTTKPETMTSGDIRGLATKVSKQNLTQKEISIPVGALRVVFAVPSDKRVTSVLDVNGLGAEIFSSFATTTVDVEGANGYEAKTYNVYYLDYANPNDKANKYKVTVA